MKKQRIYTLLGTLSFDLTVAPFPRFPVFLLSIFSFSLFSALLWFFAGCLSCLFPLVCVWLSSFGLSPIAFIR